MTVMSSTCLASRVALNARLTQSQAENAIKALGPAILETLANGHAIEFEGFGLFKVDRRTDGSLAARLIQSKKVREVLNDNP